MLVIDPDDPHRAPIALRFRVLDEKFAICRLNASEGVPGWANRGTFTSITRAPDELSIVCEAKNVPAEIKQEPEWICLQLQGPFPFSQVGVLQSFIRPLAEGDVPIFAVSTFDTDYVLIQTSFCGLALHLLHDAGHEIVSEDENWRKLIE